MAERASMEKIRFFNVSVRSNERAQERVVQGGIKSVLGNKPTAPTFRSIAVLPQWLLALG